MTYQAQEVSATYCLRILGDFSRCWKNFSVKKNRDLRVSYIDPLSNLGLNTSIDTLASSVRTFDRDGTIIGNNVSIMDDVKIGKDCFIKSGSIIGEKGFGIEFDDEMIPISIPQSKVETEIMLYRLLLQRTSTISTKMDHYWNRRLCSNAHNCDIGQYCILTASCCFGGSVKTGHYCWFGLNSTIKNGIKVSNYNMVGTHANVVKNTKILKF